MTEEHPQQDGGIMIHRSIYLSINGEMKAFVDWCTKYDVNSKKVREYSTAHGMPISKAFCDIAEKQGLHFDRQKMIEYTKLNTDEYIISARERQAGYVEDKMKNRHTLYDVEYFLPVGAAAGRWVVEKGIDYERLNRVLDIGRNVRYKECKRVKQ